MFDGHSGICTARRHIATADEFDEGQACEDLPRHSILLEQVSVQPLAYYKALVCPHDGDTAVGHGGHFGTMSDGGGGGGDGGGGGGGSSGLVINVVMTPTQAEQCKALEDEFQDSNIPRSEIRQMFVVLDYNVESTRNALLVG
jgi:hypothetical protein